MIATEKELLKVLRQTDSLLIFVCTSRGKVSSYITSKENESIRSKTWNNTSFAYLPPHERTAIIDGAAELLPGDVDVDIKLTAKVAEKDIFYTKKDPQGFFYHEWSYLRYVHELKNK